MPTKYRIETGSFAAYRTAPSQVEAMKLLYFRMKGADRSLRGKRFADATASWTCTPARRQPRRARG